MTNKRKKSDSQKPPIILVFGEDENDREAIAELTRALRPDLPRPQSRRKPQVLVKGRENAKARKNAVDVDKVVRAELVRRRVLFVIAHEDCDAVEPAHLALSERIEAHLANRGLVAIAATPAWELEAWWFLWPQAALRVNSKWRNPSRRGSATGRIENAKEAWRRALRPTREKTRDYVESDSPKIARAVRELDIVGDLDARSDSFARFSDLILRWGSD